MGLGKPGDCGSTSAEVEPAKSSPAEFAQLIAGDTQRCVTCGAIS